MSYDESDAEYDHDMEEWAEYAQDAARMEFYNKLTNEIINDFATSRLQAFYLAHPGVIQAPLDALNEARSLVVGHPSAALVFAVAVTEVCFNLDIIEPRFYGLVHTEPSAKFLMELAIAPREERLVEIMQKILAQHGGIDLHNFTRPGSAQMLWKEIQTLKKRRNVILHRCEVASSHEATQAIEVAKTIIEVIFPATIARLGLHLDEGLQVCTDMDCTHPKR